MTTRTHPLLEPGELIPSSRMMEITGCTKQDLEKLRREGFIKAASKTSKGWALYDSDALHVVLNHQNKKNKPIPEVLPADMTFNATQSCAVIRLLKEGKDMDEVQLELNLHPRMLRGILRERELLAGHIFLYKDMVDKINELDLEGNFPIKNAKDLFSVLRIASEERKCRKCRRRAKSQMCSRCERNSVLKNLTFVESKKPVTDESGDDVSSADSDADQVA